MPGYQSMSKDIRWLNLFSAATSCAVKSPFFTSTVAVESRRLNAYMLFPGSESPRARRDWTIVVRSFGTLRGGLSRSHTVMERMPPGARHRR
jgi:hypothetical protein